MKTICVTNDGGNLVFDSSHPGCRRVLQQTHGEQYIFIQALDIGYPQSRLTKPQKVRYWGKYNAAQPESSIIDILHNGSEWPDLSEK